MNSAAGSNLPYSFVADTERDGVSEEKASKNGLRSVALGGVKVKARKNNKTEAQMDAHAHAAGEKGISYCYILRSIYIYIHIPYT